MQLQKGLKAAIKVVTAIMQIQPYKKAVSEQRGRLVGGKIQPFKRAVSGQRRGKSASRA